MSSNHLNFVYLCHGFMSCDLETAHAAHNACPTSSQLHFLEKLRPFAAVLDQLKLCYTGGEVFEYDVARPMGEWCCQYIARRQRLPSELEFTAKVRCMIGLDPLSEADEALNSIQHLLSGREWSVDVMDRVANIVRGTGREIAEL